ncbi:hypothetical protein D3C72_1348980 [compost metagenome]
MVGRSSLEKVLFCLECKAPLRPQATDCDQCGAAVSPTPEARPAVQWVQAGTARRRYRLKALYTNKLLWVAVVAAVPLIAGAVVLAAPRPLSPAATLDKLNAAIESRNEQRLSGYIDTPGMAQAVYGELFDAAKARDQQPAGASGDRARLAALTYEGLETRKYEVISAVEAKIRQDLFADPATGAPVKLALVDYRETDTVHEAKVAGARRAKKARACTVTLRNPSTGRTFVFSGSHYLDSPYAWFLERLDAASPTEAYGREVVAYARRAFEVVHREEADKARSAL